MATVKARKTKESIISTALSQSSSIGLENISLGKLAAEIGMSKSGLFAHFDSKETLQLSIIEAASELFNSEVLEPAFSAPKGLARLHALYENYLDWMAGAGGLEKCPFTVFIQEFESRPGPIRDALAKCELEWREVFSKTVDGAIKNNQLIPGACSNQVTFELIGAANSFQISFRLLGNKKARSQALRALNKWVKETS